MAQESKNLSESIQNCLKCHFICLETINYCLQQGGKYANADRIQLLMDCAHICQISADFMIRNSSMHVYTCEACAEICRNCTIECADMSDEELDQCAEACRDCAASCRKMVQTVKFH